jgi:two-component system response regulator DctR
LDGIETLSRIRQEQIDVDVIVISAANDLRTIQRMLQNGAVDYIMKPFKFERVKKALENYRMLRSKLADERPVSQDELDEMLFGNSVKNTAFANELPKGLQSITLKQIMLFLMNQTDALSAEEVAEGVGIARVTARRYLDFLEKTGQVKLDLQYGIGRPVNKYIWVHN